MLSIVQSMCHDSIDSSPKNEVFFKESVGMNMITVRKRRNADSPIQRHRRIEYSIVLNPPDGKNASRHGVIPLLRNIIYGICRFEISKRTPPSTGCNCGSMSSFSGYPYRELYVITSESAAECRIIPNKESMVK